MQLFVLDTYASGYNKMVNYGMFLVSTYLCAAICAFMGSGRSLEDTKKCADNRRMSFSKVSWSGCFGHEAMFVYEPMFVA